ncbi:MAG: CBS domain-containing protein [Proteobacteria bacterium]|nr:CBS domain-containing protein [Pseudomonadota bacterium]
MQAIDIMTQSVITAPPDATVEELARVMLKHRIDAVPIMDGGKLVGIVNRTDMLRALASRGAVHTTEDDRRLRDAVLAELQSHPWGGAPTVAQIMVRDGVVHLWGVFTTEEERRARIEAAEAIPGVVKVEDHMDHGTRVDPLNLPNWPKPAPP